MPNEIDLSREFRELGRMMAESVDLYVQSPSIEGAVFQYRGFQVLVVQEYMPFQLHPQLLGRLNVPSLWQTRLWADSLLRTFQEEKDERRIDQIPVLLTPFFLATAH